MKRKLGFVTALVFVLSLGLSTAFAQSTKPAKQSVGQQATTKTASTSKSGTKAKMMSKKSGSRNHRHHRKIARRVKNGERERKEKEAKSKRS